MGFEELTQGDTPSKQAFKEREDMPALKVKWML
jgi:hypothetical protein